MPKQHSNGRRSTWAKHNSVLNGHLDKVLAVLVKLPGLVERNEKRLEAFERKQRQYELSSSKAA